MVIKQINFIESTGKLILSDDNNNHYYCDIFGNKKQEFLTDITGLPKSFQKRKEFLKKSTEEIYSITENFNFEKNKNHLYLPIINKFEGYSKFPQPLSPPFYNLGKSEVNRDNVKNLIKTLKKHFTNKKVISQFEMVEKDVENYHLNYMMSPINFHEGYNDRDKESLIKLIDEHFEKFKRENRYKVDQMSKDPMIKALKRFRLLLVENKSVNVESRMGLIRPSEKIIDKFRFVQHKNIGSYLKKKEKIENVMKTGKNEIKKKYFGNKILDNNNLDRIKMQENLNIFDNPNDLSFLSGNSDEERKLQQENLISYDLKKSKNLISQEFLRKSLEVEKNFINGFREIPLKEEAIMKRPKKIKFKTEADYYPETMNLLKQGNKF